MRSNSEISFEEIIQKNYSKKWKLIMSIDDEILPHEQHTDPEDDCEHFWLFVPDWEGDPSVPNGTRDCSYWKCDLCDAETYERPDGIEDDYPGEEFEPEYENKDGLTRADFEYDPLRRDP